jgi:hypothetical protein
MNDMHSIISSNLSAVKTLLGAYFFASLQPNFDYRRDLINSSMISKAFAAWLKRVSFIPSEIVTPFVLVEIIH